MKYELKNSKMAIVCVLCTGISAAYGAASVRSLGGAGTYSSASSAATAKANNESGAAVRGGSVRVSPATTTGGTVRQAASVTSGRAATTPRLSIGKYLGGGVSVSGGGSSIRPQNPSYSVSDGTSGGGAGDAGLSSTVQDLADDIKKLQEINTGLSDRIADKQDVLVLRKDGYVLIETNVATGAEEIFVDVDGLKSAMALSEGREVELGVNEANDALVWRYKGDSDWIELVDFAAITNGYATVAEMQDLIEQAIADASQGYATKADLSGLLTKSVADSFYATAEQGALAASAVQPTVLTTALGEYAKTTDVESKIAEELTKFEGTAAITGLDERITQNAEKLASISNDSTGIAAIAAGDAAAKAAAALSDAKLYADEKTAGMLTAADLSGYATTTKVTEDIAAATKDMLTTGDLTDYAKASDVTTEIASATSGLLSKTEASTTYAPVGDYATKTELAGKVDTSALSGYATTTKVTEDIAAATKDMLTTGDLTDYAKASDVTTEIASATSGLLSKTEASTTYAPIGDYATKTELAGKADTSALSGYATTTKVTEDIAAATKDMLTTSAAAATYATTDKVAEDIAAATKDMLTTSAAAATYATTDKVAEDIKTATTNISPTKIEGANSVTGASKNVPYVMALIDGKAGWYPVDVD